MIRRLIHRYSTFAATVLLTFVPFVSRANDLSCSSITDTFCDTLWDKDHLGEIKVFDGLVTLGRSKKSDVGSLRLIDYRALADSLPRLPKDMIERATPILSDLKDALTHEFDRGKGNKNDPDGSFWTERLVDNANKFARLKSQVVHERQLKIHPEIIKLRRNDRNYRQKLALAYIEYDLENQILDAKYLRHPNWKRVVRVVDTIQKRLLEEVERLPVNQQQKSFMLNQVKTVQLRLPYVDPRLTGADDACGSTTVNAFYDPSRHVFTVCAGWFNANQSDTAMYQVIAHEISHSVDSDAVASYFNRANGTINKALAPLKGMKNQKIFTCEDWAKLKKETLIPSVSIAMKQDNDLEKLYRCLAPKKIDAFEAVKIRDSTLR